MFLNLQIFSHEGGIDLRNNKDVFFNLNISHIKCLDARYILAECTQLTLIFKKVLRRLRRAHVLNVNYVDDQVTIIEGESRKQFEDTGQKAIDEIVETLAELKITNSPGKYTLMIASKLSVKLYKSKDKP